MARHRLAVIGVLAVAVTLAVATAGRGNGNRSSSIPLAPAFSAATLYAHAGDDWISNGGGVTNDRYSTLAKINTSNVGKLKLAWKIHLNSGGSRAFSQEGTPIVYKGVMYISTGNDDVFALDAKTGKQLWVYHSHIPVSTITTVCCGFSNRGVALGDGKVYIAEIPGQVVALDQRTGAVLWRTWNTRWQEGGTMTLAPLYYDHKVIVGISGGEMGVRGAVTAFDSSTGAQLWRFYTCPDYGDIGGGTWSGNEWQHCGAAVWSTPTVDPNRGLVYFGVGNPDPWSSRGPGNDLFTDSFVALDVNSGTLRWWYQTVHHDLWDYDVTSPTVLFDATIGGHIRHGISAPGKTGWLYELDRNSGHPLLGIREKKVPQVKSQNTSATQPYPVGQPFADQCAHKANYTSPKTGKIVNAPNGKPYKIACIFTPYSDKQYVVYAPGTEGGSDWQPSTFDPQTHYQYICGYNGNTALAAYPNNKNPAWVAGQSYFGSQFGYGLVKGFGDAGTPDQGAHRGGYMKAMDVTTNHIAWTVPMPTSGDCYDAPFTTAGGLVFVGHNSTTNPTYSAYDAKTGKNLWNYPTNVKVAFSAPGITYSAGGKQYVAALQGGGGGNSNQQRPTGHGDILEAWTLP